ncbi:MAG: hypothetical protein MZV63_21005 [Marinilabiliales bacterium]|nr:hypothetical protein [Marinilabiliales bacterium]
MKKYSNYTIPQPVIPTPQQEECFTADVIEFDITGQYLIYDSYNELTSTTGEDIGYWDIGIINVWDNNRGDWGDGTISKLYGSLPEDISIGNPVFSKNSPWIIAFDYIDAGERPSMPSWVLTLTPDAITS